MDFTGKNILITGGSRGIGKATAIAFAERGGRVCINFLKNKKAAKATIDSLAGEGHFAAKADMGEPDAVRQLMETVIGEFGTLNVVVNNAGIYLPHPIAESSYEEWQEAWKKTLDINLFAAANVCYFAARQMIRQESGHIINVSSRGAFRGEPEHTAYGVSKAGLNSLTQSLARELGKYGISVTAVAPGFVETDMAQEFLEGKNGKNIKNQSPMGRVATPEEVAHAIVFLASEKAVFVTGGIIDVNGASYLR
ncbi:MAG TPA: SDR family oxidoreductase [Bacteroidetes bacterium]|nr:SDR family oxidoreductase [Bacteroidota bacterium]